MMKLIQSNPICRGDIYNVIQPEGNLPTGSEMWANRPAIIISNNATNKKSSIVNVVYLSTKLNKRPMPYHIEVISNNKKAIAICEQVFTVDKSRLTHHIGHITEEELSDVEKGILFALGISNTVYPSSLFDKWINYIDKNNIIFADERDDETQMYINEIQRLKAQINAYKTLLFDKNGVDHEEDAYDKNNGYLTH